MHACVRMREGALTRALRKGGGGAFKGVYKKSLGSAPPPPGYRVWAQPQPSWLWLRCGRMGAGGAGPSSNSSPVS